MDGYAPRHRSVAQMFPPIGTNLIQLCSFSFVFLLISSTILDRPRTIREGRGGRRGGDGEVRWGGNGSRNGAFGMTTMSSDGDLQTVARNISSAFPITIDDDTCDVPHHRTTTPKEGQVPTTGGRMYLGGMPDLAVKIKQKSHDAGNTWDLAQCRHMVLVGGGEILSTFRRSLAGGRL